MPRAQKRRIVVAIGQAHGCPRRLALHGLDDGLLRAVGDDPALVDNDQAVDQLEHAVAMGGDQQRRLATEGLGQAGDQVPLGGQVHGARRLVEEDDLRPGQQQPGDRHRLLLAAGQIGAAFADRHVETARMIADELVDAGHAGDLQELLVGGIGAARSAGFP